MASSIMHMAVTKIIADNLPHENPDRLMLGAVLPDAYADGSAKARSHLEIQICGHTKKTYDLTAFREKFAEKMRMDSLYLGYYLHLVQDLAYRDFVYREHHWDPYISGNVKRLHNDYAILNAYVIRKYHLQNILTILTVPADFSKEPINALCPFEIEEFLERVKHQFIPCDQGDIFFFTKEMADSFIKRAADICIEEIKALSAGNHGMDEYKRAWDKKAVSLLGTTLNTRDLGGYRTAAGTYTKYSAFLRSDAVKAPDKRDIDFLTGHQICTIIDMRGKQEVLSAPEPFAGMRQFQYYNLPVEEGSSIPESVSDVPYSYMRIVEAENMAEVFRKMSKADTGVLFHCSAGKDRTGVVSAVLLLLAGVSRSDIVDNYMLTKTYKQEYNEREGYARLMKRFPGLDINILIPHETYMCSFLDMFHEKYINAEQYLKSIGLDEKEIECIRNRI